MPGMPEELRNSSLIAFYFGTGAAKALQSADPADATPGSVLRTLRRRSYRDMNRTLRGVRSMSEDARISFDEVIDAKLSGLLERLPTTASQKDFDDLHREWRDSVIEEFNQRVLHTDSKWTMTHGHAQKWLNMFLKYAAVLDLPETRSAYKWFHVPIDRRVYEAMRTKNITIGSKVAWSQLDAFQYKTAQDNLRAHCDGLADGRGIPPLDWEAEYWITPTG